MKKILVLLFCSYIQTHVAAQVSFDNINYTISSAKNANGTTLVCSGKSFSLKFEVPQKSVIILQNIARIDSQVVQITPLQIGNLHPKTKKLGVAEAKELLSDYSKYELDYFASELNVEVINPNSQWVVAGSRTWLVWYFRVGESHVATEKKTEIQLFASTVIAEKILTINAPIITGGDFAKAALIVNNLMETLANNTK